LHLRRLDLIGFKSFGTRVTTELQPGIVVIVGPNGSGKSNVSDAVLWVLGEQSARAVRARKAEEVIFAGSAARQPLGMAEVSLVLDNADASLPIEYDEVRVTRRLYRSGESEYLLNGARVRLKDITQLLLHAGLSPDSYAVVGQGSIDELILQRPDERRAVFENVADIRRHQLRLTETRSKLVSTQANLVRVQDILAELTPHVRRLKTQAERSARAEHFRSELRTLLLRSFRWRLARARADQRRAEAESLEATRRAQQAEAESLAGEQSLHNVDARLASLEDRFSELRPRAEAVREQLRVAERGLAVLHERLAAMGEQQSSAQADLVRMDASLARLAIDQQAASVPSAEPQPRSPSVGDAHLVTLRAQLASEAGAFESAQSQRATLVAQIELLDASIRDTEASLADTTENIHSLQADVAVDLARQTDRDSRLVTLQQQIASLAEDHHAHALSLEHTRRRLSTSAEAHNVAAARLETARERLRVASQQADRLHGALQALGAADLHRSDDTDLPSDWQSALAGLPVVGLAGELATRIRPIDLLLAGYVRRIVVLADDAAAREAHRRLATHLPADAPGWAVLSLDGLLLTGEGPRPMEAGEDRGQSALADWARQVRQLEADLDTAETARRSALVDVQAARDALDDAEASERGARLAQGELEARLGEVVRAETTAAAEARELEVEQERAAASAVRRDEVRERAAARVQALHDELGAARAQRETLAEALRQAEEILATTAERVAGLRTDLAALEATAGQREAELAAREALHARIQTEIASTLDLHEAATARLEQLGQQETELRVRESGLVRDMHALRRELEPAETELQSAEGGRAALLAERQSVEQQVAVLRANERLAHERREAHHVTAQRALDDLERLKTEIDETAELESELSGDTVWAEQLRLDLEQADTEPREAFDLESARRRIATLQRELRAVGGVGGSIVEEYREMSARHAFLEHQSSDLRAAMAELEQAAAELEGHMRERFSEAFGAIQAAFQNCFDQLFGGGEARLVLTEPDDLLRTGIDIVARPPGKKLQGLLSLSGGERALTIVSLLFGLLKINPTPFCVLDEVDAALDEANVQRFANLLAEFALRIQFIVVTHNRATMDMADALYGVSMDAAGVSHVFSVRPASVVDSREPVTAETRS
jgi:chromosome segregation protein